MVNEDRLPRPGPGVRRPGDPGRRRRAAGGRRLGHRGPADPAAAARRAAAGAGRVRRWWSTAYAWARTSRCGCGRSRPGQRAEPVSVIAAVPYRRRAGHPDGAAQRLADHLPGAARRCSAVIAWRVIGWTLRPVEQLRAGAEQISAPRRAGRTGAAGGRGCRCRRPPTRSGPWPITLNGMLDRLAAGPGAAAARSWPTPRTSCAARWPACGPSSRWRSGSGRAAPCRPTCWPTSTGCPRLVEDLLLLARVRRRHPAAGPAESGGRPGPARRGRGRRTRSRGCRSPCAPGRR